MNKTTKVILIVGFVLLMLVDSLEVKYPMKLLLWILCLIVPPLFWIYVDAFEKWSDSIDKTPESSSSKRDLEYKLKELKKLYSEKEYSTLIRNVEAKVKKEMDKSFINRHPVMTATFLGILNSLVMRNRKNREILLFEREIDRLSSLKQNKN